MYVIMPTALAKRIKARAYDADVPAQINRSRWSGTSRIVGLAGNEVWRFKLTFRPMPTEKEIREARAFFAALRGSVNTFEFPYLPTPQSATATTTVAVNAVAGQRFVEVASAAAVEVGMPLSLKLPTGHKRLVIVTKKTGVRLDFEPSLTEAAPIGTVVQIANPVAHVRLSESRFNYSDDMGLAGFSVDVEEAIGEAGS